MKTNHFKAMIIDSNQLVLGSQMHWITALFLLLETILLANLGVYALAKPADKTQKRYLTLLFLIILYNLSGGLFPDPKFGLSIVCQNILAYGAGFSMCMYAPWYFYKAFDLAKMRFHARYGIFIFLLGPFLLFFVGVYSLGGDLELVRKWGVVIPFFYALSVIYSMTRSLLEQKPLRNKTEIIALYLAIIPWICLTVVTYLNASQAIEVLIVNSGMVMVTLLYIRKQILTIRHSDQDRQIYYQYLLVSQQMHRATNDKLTEANQKLALANSELEEKVAERTKQLEMLNEQRMNTFSNLAHEMKTPLTLLKDYIHGIALQYPDTQALQFAKKHISKLSRDVVNMFDLLRSEKGILQYDHSTDINLSVVVLERIMLFEAAAHKRSITITHQIQPDLAVRADQTALERVVNNLIDNAIKYSPEQSRIHIRLQSEPTRPTSDADTLSQQINEPEHNQSEKDEPQQDQEHTEQLILSIADQGVGIPTEYQQVIFQPYARISHTHSHGMGMGLPIVKTILDQIGGAIHVISRPDQKPGTDFVIRMPYRKQVSDFFHLFKMGHESILDPQLPTREKLLADEYAPASYVSFSPVEFVHDPRKKTLLVVEDNVEMMQYLVDYLAPEYNTYYAFDGQKGLKKLKSMPEPDLIVSDVMMEKMDGFAFRRTLIAADSEYLSIPFLFLSAKSEEKIKGLHLKADFIEKPFEIDELIAKIDALIEIRENTREQTRLQMIDSIFQFQKQSAASLADKHYDKQQDTMQTSWSDSFVLSDQNLPLTDPSEHTGFEPQSQKHQFMRKLEYLTGLTIREKQIMAYFAHQLANKQIADKCNISESTAAKHIQNIFRKLDVSTKEQAIGFVLALKVPE
ncbi:ATP-binding protein [Cytophagaceae bacterium YF14B1]|uniref:histidine kinase n=1 Tax=Xanthocytophaga flava TaxID=3048013 RepID=A0AAE3R061_9BACT|nr:ATP-binding protein [Xanthocytophaga flavus]MDJ1485919.1 ATP-binding protein [Xanthocytophaga flavus]